MTRPRPLVRPRWGIVAALLALAVVVRASAMFYGSLSPDDATVALIAKHVLSGENFPAFFYRQTYMGSLNGIHLVPALYLFGPSPLLVRLNAIAWSLLLPLGLYHLGRRIYGEPTGLATLALAAVPPFLLVYWSTVAEPHLETNVFGVWLLLLALTAVTATSEPARTRALAVFGLLGGLALWTNVKALVVLVPALAVLALRAPRALLARGGLLMAGGLALGSMPAWLFYLVHGDRAEGTAGSVVNVLSMSIDLSPARFRGFLVNTVLPIMGTYYWTPRTPLRWASLAVSCAVYVLAVGLALGELVRRRAVQPIRRRSGLAILILTLAVSLGAVYLSEIGERRTEDTSRYALPAYIPLLVFAGALVARAGRRSRAGAAGLLAFLLLFSGWTSLRFLWPLSPSLRARESATANGYEEVRRALAIRPVEALYIDETMNALVWEFLLDRPTVSALTTDIYVPNALAADAASRIDILAGNDAIDVERNLAALGATFRQTTIAGWRLFEDVQAPARAYRMLPRVGWRVAGDPRAPASVADGDLGTAWPPPPPDGPRDAVVVDLGRPHEVARLIFWPSLPSADVFPLTLSASVDGLRWERLGTVPTLPRQPGFVASGRPVFRPRNGWLELAVSPRPLRYVRIEPEEPAGGAPWGVSELHVYEPGSAEPPPTVSTEALLGWLRGHDVQRLLADPVLSARVDRATGGAVTTLLANGVLDNHGEAPPGWLARPLRLRAGDALLVPIEDAPELRDRLEAAHTEFLADTLAGHALVRVVGPLASPAPCMRPTGRAASREPGGQGGRPQVTLEARLDEEALVSGVRLWHPTTPGPTAVQVAASRDGRTWQPAGGARVVPAWGWAGRTLFTAWDPLAEVVFDPAPARQVRVTVTPDSEDLRILCVRGDVVGRARR